MGQLPVELIINTGSLRSGEINYDPELPQGALWNHPYTAGDHPRALLWIKWAHHITGTDLLPQKRSNHL